MPKMLTLKLTFNTQATPVAATIPHAPLAPASTPNCEHEKNVTIENRWEQFCCAALSFADIKCNVLPVIQSGPVIETAHTLADSVIPAVM
jgi:hypothetical protein